MASREIDNNTARTITTVELSETDISSFYRHQTMYDNWVDLIIHRLCNEQSLYSMCSKVTVISGI